MRLIDADALIVRLRNESVIPFSKMLLNDEHRWFIKLEDMIKTQPTAYSVEKVVAELEALKEAKHNCEDIDCNECKYTTNCWGGEMSFKVAFDKAISTAKAGGVE